MQRFGDDATAFSHRDSPFILNIVSSWLDSSDNDKNKK